MQLKQNLAENLQPYIRKDKRLNYNELNICIKELTKQTNSKIDQMKQKGGNNRGEINEIKK